MCQLTRAVHQRVLGRRVRALWLGAGADRPFDAATGSGTALLRWQSDLVPEMLVVM